MTFVEFIAQIPPQYYLIVGASLFVGAWRIHFMNKQSMAAIEQAKIANQKQYSEIIEKAFNILNEGNSLYSPMAMSILNGAVLDKDKFEHLYLSLVDVLINLARIPKDDRTPSEQVNTQHLVNFITHRQSPLWNNETSSNFTKVDFEEIAELSKGIIFEGCDFSGLNFSDRRLRHFEFINCCFDDCNFSNVTFMAQLVEHCSFERVNFECSRLMIGKTVNSNFSHAIFNSVKWIKGPFVNCTFDNADFLHSHRNGMPKKQQDLDYLIFEKCTFKNSKIREVEFVDVQFTYCSFEFASISGAKMNFSRLQDCIFLKMKIFSAVHLKSTRFYNCCFVDVHLNDVWLQNAELHFAKFLRGSLFTQNLKRTHFEQCGEHHLELLGGQISEDTFSKLTEYDYGEMKKVAKECRVDLELDI